MFVRKMLDMSGGTSLDVDLVFFGCGEMVKQGTGRRTCWIYDF